MSDVSTSETGKVERKTVSKREFITEGGEVVKSMEEAAGARYILLGDKGTRQVRVFDQLFGEPGKDVTMYAIMGFHTKLGNVANTVLNDKDSPGSPEDAADEVAAFIADVAEGKWAERGGGGGFQKVDRDALTAAIVEYAKSKGKETDPLSVRQKLDDTPALIGQWRKVPEVLADYTRRVGSRGLDVAGMLDAI